jgi:integrase
MSSELLDEFSPETNRNISKHLKHWLEYCEISNVDADVITAYDDHYVQFIEYLIKKAISFISIKTIHAYGVRKLYEFKTKGKKITPLNIFSADLKLKEYKKASKISGNKTRRVSFPVTRYEMDLFIQRLLSSNATPKKADVEVAALVSLLSSTGTRLSTATSLTLDCFEFMKIENNEALLAIRMDHWKTKTVRKEVHRKHISGSLVGIDTVSLLEKHLHLAHSTSLKALSKVVDFGDEGFIDNASGIIRNLNRDALLFGKNMGGKISRLFKKFGLPNSSAHDLRRGTAVDAERKAIESKDPVSRIVSNIKQGWTRNSKAPAHYCRNQPNDH